MKNFSLFSHPINIRSEKIKVFWTSNPIAMISLTFSIVNFFALSIVKSFHKYFSSSVNCMTSGTLNESWSHLVNINGIKWPKCRAEDDGPRPVYKKNGFLSSKRFNIWWKSRWEKKTPLRKRWWALRPVISSIRLNILSSILLQPKRTVNQFKK